MHELNKIDQNYLLYSAKPYKLVSNDQFKAYA